MSKVTVLAFVLAFAVGVSAENCQVDWAASQQPVSEKAVNDNGSAIRVSIMTGGGLFGPPKTRFKVGEQVPITITMVNASTQPIYVCDSSTLYQDLPQLVKDGRTLPSLKWQSFQLADSKTNHTCQKEALPEPEMLNPTGSSVVDWFILVASTISTDPTWYDALPPGKYEL